MCLWFLGEREAAWSPAAARCAAVLLLMVVVMMLVMTLMIGM